MNTLDMEKVRKFVEDRQPVEVSAGILEDWFWTADSIYAEGKWINPNKAYTHSTWGTPGFKAEMSNGDLIEVDACVHSEVGNG